MAALDIAMLHFTPVAGELERNFDIIARGAEQASVLGAALLLTPELSLSGYDFVPQIGTGWIGAQIPMWRARFAELAQRTGVAVLATMPERDEVTGSLHNAATLFDRMGKIVAVHRKIAVIPGGSEAWSSAGDTATVTEFLGLRIAIIICADACLSRLASTLEAERVDLVVSASAWSPGLHGPDGEWEALSVALGRTVLVCNRSGRDGWNFEDSSSVLVRGGRRVKSWTGPGPTLIAVRDASGASPEWTSSPLA